jgi:hypothetical protein
MRKGSTYNDIAHFIFFDLTSKASVDLDPALVVLFFNNVQEECIEVVRRGELVSCRTIRNGTVPKVCEAE